jgi:type IV pilus assembly protein PilO
MTSPAIEPQRRQRLLLGVLILGMFGYGAWEYIHKPGNERIARLEARLQRLQLQKQQAQLLLESGGLDELRRQQAEQREELQVFERLVASAAEVADLLDALAAEARWAGVELVLLQPGGSSGEVFYSRRGFDVVVVGHYHDIASFLSRVASLPRLITPRGLRLSILDESPPGTSPRLEARFSIETFVLPSASPDPNPDDE